MSKSKNRPPGNFCLLCNRRIKWSFQQEFYWVYPYEEALRPVGMVHKSCAGDEPERVFE